MKNKTSLLLLAGSTAFLTTALPLVQAATIAQTTNSASATSEWNDAIWGGATPTAANDYVTASGLMTSNSTSLGTGTNVTGRVRAYGAANSASPSFAGNSLSIGASTELLLKDPNETYSANIVLNGGVLRWSPNSGGNASFAGSITVAADSVLGVVQSSASVFTIASTLTGSSSLRLASGQGNANVITFDDGVGTSLNGYAGTLDIGGGANAVVVDFNRAYAMGLAGLKMGGYATLDVLNLDANITVGSFSFGANTLAAGTYDAAALNSTYGNGSQFTGAGTLTVVPEPSTALVGGLGLLCLLRRREPNQG
jgi:hypothetical protein